MDYFKINNMLNHVLVFVLYYLVGTGEEMFMAYSLVLG